MTRFGMKEPKTERSAELIHARIAEGKRVAGKVARFRDAFQTVHYSFDAGGNKTL